MKKMKLIGLMGLMMFALTSHAQKGQHENRKEKIYAMKVGYITKKLDLTTEEAQKFWPIYNELEAKKKVLRKERKEHLPPRPTDGEPIKELSDGEISKLILKDFEIKQKEIDLEIEYFEKFKSVLSLQKIMKLRHAERSFNHEILRKMRERNGGKEGGIPPPPGHFGPPEH